MPQPPTLLTGRCGRGPVTLPAAANMNGSSADVYRCVTRVLTSASAGAVCARRAGPQREGTGGRPARPAVRRPSSSIANRLPRVRLQRRCTCPSRRACSGASARLRMGRRSAAARAPGGTCLARGSAGRAPVCARRGVRSGTVLGTTDTPRRSPGRQGPRSASSAGCHTSAHVHAPGRWASNTRTRGTVRRGTRRGTRRGARNS